MEGQWVGVGSGLYGEERQSQTYRISVAIFNMAMMITEVLRYITKITTMRRGPKPRQKEPQTGHNPPLSRAA